VADLADKRHAQREIRHLKAGPPFGLVEIEAMSLTLWASATEIRVVFSPRPFPGAEITPNSSLRKAVVAERKSFSAYSSTRDRTQTDATKRQRTRTDAKKRKSTVGVRKVVLRPFADVRRRLPTLTDSAS
jgi:hypothetical protein